MKSYISLLLALVLFPSIGFPQTLQLGVSGETKTFELGDASPYIGSYNGNKFKGDWNVTLVKNPENIFQLNGPIKVTNLTDSTLRFRILLDLPLQETLDGVTYGGAGSVKMTSNINGGTISCGGLSFLYGPARNKAKFPIPFFYCPFMMSASGASNSSTNNFIGLPLGTLTEDKNVSSVGMIADVNVTSGEALTLNTNVLLKKKE